MYKDLEERKSMWLGNWNRCGVLDYRVRIDRTRRGRGYIIKGFFEYYVENIRIVF